MVNRVFDSKIYNTLPKSLQQKADESGKDASGVAETSLSQDAVSISDGAMSPRQAAYSNAFGDHSKALEALHSDETGKTREDGLEKILEYYAAQMDGLAEMEDGEDKLLAMRALDDAMGHAVASFALNATPHSIDTSKLKIADAPLNPNFDAPPEIVDGVYTLNQKASVVHRAQSLAKAFMAAARGGTGEDNSYMGLFNKFIERNTSENDGNGSALRLSNIYRYVDAEKQNKVLNDQKDVFTTRQDTMSALNAYRTAMDYYGEK